MVTESTQSWTDETTGRERVRAVVETLEGAATVATIADRAEVSPTTAADELGRLESDNRVRETLVDDRKGYEPNPTRLFFDELMALIEDHGRSELEAQLEQLTAEAERLREEFEADSLGELRERMAEEELSAAETREIRNGVSTWDALETELTLVRHALRLYDDVTELDAGGSSMVTV